MTCLHAIMANGHVRQRNAQTTGLYKTDILEDGRGREEEKKVTKFIKLDTGYIMLIFLIKKV